MRYFNIKEFYCNCCNKEEMKDRWRKQLKFSSIESYNDLLEEEENELDENPYYEKKSNSEIEAEARESTLKTLDEMYDFYEDIDRSSSFAFYINSFKNNTRIRG